MSTSTNGYVSGEFPCFHVVTKKADPKFVHLYLSQEPIWDEIGRISSGQTNISRLRLKVPDFLRMKIPLPPLTEQRRIVGRIEALAGRVSETQRLRREAVEEAEAFAQSIANMIFNEYRLKKYPTFNLEEISDIRSGVTLGRKLNGKTIWLPYLRVANVQDGLLDLRQIKEVEVLEEEKDKWQLMPGDILLTEGGDWDKLGRGTVWHGEIPNCIHQNHIFRVRVNQKMISPDYISRLISSPYGKAYFQAASKQTTNLASINQRQLRSFKVFIPPLDEQHCIVAKLDRLRAQVDELRRLQAESQKELDALMPSILDRAFKGEL